MNFNKLREKSEFDQVKIDKIDQNFALIPPQRRHLTDQAEWSSFAHCQE